MSFFKNAFDWLKKVFVNTDWTHAAQVSITVAAPLVETVADVVAPAAAPEVTSIINIIKTDFGVVSTTLGQIQTAPGNVSAITLLKNSLASIKTNLAQLLTVADIKDAGTKQTVTMTVNTIVGEIDAILASIPAAPAAA